MYRAEIVSNQSVQDDITERLDKEIPGIQYTVIPEVHGKGLKTKKLGDVVWPEMNFILFAYIVDGDAKITLRSAFEPLFYYFPGRQKIA